MSTKHPYRPTRYAAPSRTFTPQDDAAYQHILKVRPDDEYVRVVWGRAQDEVVVEERDYTWRGVGV